ncbi:MAG: stage 0 sporulation family protein [Oscillospiraceae bacterium]|nr:stage 0 sporulation family protein [Oscillospiraceae bacterium]
MTNVISVRFRSGSKTYYFDPQGIAVSTGDDVIVETSQGLEYASCTQGNHDVEDNQVVQPLRPLIRVATENDRRTAEYNRQREDEAFAICQKKIQQHKLEMKLVRVECSFDGSKILFFFTADGRVDFRELVKDLASVFRSRIELRQIGVRDEAKMLGGLGICGRPFCCSQFMDDFVPVSIKMAKTQNLSLNPTKISGTCGRLMCCLKHEQDAYEDALKRLPKNDSFVQTPDGPGNVSDVNILKEKVTVRLDDRPESPQCYHACEICVLRNGKGSRDGIVVPKERPERYVEARVEEEPLMPTLISDFTPVTDLPEERNEEARTSRRHRGHRGGRKNVSANKEAKSEAAVPKAAEAPTTEKKEPPKDGEKSSRGRRRGHRGGRKTTPAEAKNGEGKSTVKEPAAKVAAKPAAKGESSAPKSESASGQGGEKKRRHRGGRRHRSSGAKKTES